MTLTLGCEMVDKRGISQTNHKPNDYLEIYFITMAL